MYLVHSIELLQGREVARQGESAGFGFAGSDSVGIVNQMEVGDLISKWMDVKYI